MSILLMVYHAKLEMSIGRAVMDFSGVGLLYTICGIQLRTFFRLDHPVVERDGISGHGRPLLCYSDLRT